MLEVEEDALEEFDQSNEEYIYINMIMDESNMANSECSLDIWSSMKWM